MPPDDPAALRAVLLPLMADRRACAELGAKARARVLECFDWEGIADQYLELLERAATRGGEAMEL